jgi:hypothetical protein
MAHDIADSTAPPVRRPPPSPERTTARAARGRRRTWREAGGGASIPIVNDAHEVVGWTRTAPVIENGRLRHAEVERVLRGPIYCTQIALVRAQDIRDAGGPADWVGPWRCLALCPIGARQGPAPRAAERR